MRILKNIFLFLLLASASMSNAQLTISTEGGEAAMGNNVEIDITANVLNSLSTFQFNVVWDSLVMTFVEVKNVNSELPSYSLGTNFGLPGDGSIKNGTVSTSWTDFTQAQSIPNDSRLFTIVLSAIGAECATSSFGFDNEEAGDGNFAEVPVTANGGSILVSGPDCGGGEVECVNECEGSSDVILSMPCITAPAGTNICIPISVYNFNNIEAVQSGIIWDPTVMEYTGFQNLGFTQSGGNNPNAGFIFNDNAAASGMIREFWSDETGETPQSLPDGSVLYELCFDLIGDDGDVISINFGDIGSFGVEVVQLGAGVDFCLDQGTITIGDIGVEPVQLIANDVSGSQNGEACVDVTVREFTDIRGYQANLQWDNSIITYNRVQMLNSTLGLTVSNFNPSTSPANLRFAWDNLNSATLPNDTKLFQVCFDVIGDCNSTPTSAVTFESTAASDIEFSDPDGMGLPFTVTNGSVTVLPCQDMHTCSLSDVTQSACVGENGSIDVIVDADNTCECNWYLNGGTTSIQTTPGNGNCNLASASAGNYTFELSDASGAIVCTFDQSIIDPPAITTNPAITNAACGDSGVITLNASGGTGALSYTWVPNVSTTDSASDLAAGDYTITIFDENDCTVTIMRTITTDLDPLTLNTAGSTVINPTCNGSGDGSIVGAAQGGCSPYTFAYEGGDGTGLFAGDYGVTVTDSNGNTAEGTLTVTDPDVISLMASVSDETLGAMNGSITITSNGATPLTFMWNQNVSTTETASNLSAGFYDVTVTDANGCTASRDDIEVKNNTGGTPVFGTVTTTDVTSCFGDCTGVISSSIENGAVGDLTIELSGPSDSTLILNATGSFTLDDLCAGTYSMTVTDSEGNTSSANSIVVGQPSAITATINTGDDFNNCDGFIEVDPSGGAEPYTYEWVNQAWDTPIVDNVCAGFYDLVITDAIGCKFMEMGIEIEDFNNGGSGPCWVPRNIITPNGDGLNDFFTFTCVGQRVASLQIFDRYGREVYTSANYDNTFNGVSDSGVVLGEGGYMWVLNIDFGSQGRQIEQGTLTLLRD